MPHVLDLVSIGEVLMEFTRVDPSTYRSHWAGDVANTAFYASRLGLRVGLVTSFGNDLFTHRIQRELAHEGIDLSMTAVRGERRNGLYFIEPVSTAESRFHYWRHESAATAMFEGAEIDTLYAYCSSSKYVLISGITLAIVADVDPLVRLLRQLKSTSTAVVFDPNYRSALWPSTAQFKRTAERILTSVDIFLPSAMDLEALWPADPEGGCRSCGAALSVIKRGSHGSILLEGKERTAIPPYGVSHVVDPTGAGDAFNAGFIAGLRRRSSAEEAVQLASRLGAHVVSVVGAIDEAYEESRTV
jgi:2-dehydro-3-deoxygluconokinase